MNNTRFFKKRSPQGWEFSSSDRALGPVFSPQHCPPRKVTFKTDKKIGLTSEFTPPSEFIGDEVEITRINCGCRIKYDKVKIGSKFT